MNKDLLIFRARTIKLIRAFFDGRGYVEMHTPRLVGLPGQEPYLEPFPTEVIEASGSHHPAALITSPEYAMKRLLAEGFEKIYDLGPCFRNNEPWDGTHDPDFLMIEWYRKDAGLQSLMDETEEMVRGVASGKWEVGNQSNPTPHFQLPTSRFRRLTCEDAWKSTINVDLATLINNRDAMAELCRTRGQTVADGDTWDDLYYKIFLTEIEPKISIEPTFLYRYPISMAALAKPCADDPRFANRVELYMNGLELANGFEELTDTDEQRRRFIEDQNLRQSLGKKTWPLDERFLAALPKIGRASGIAFGVDRFVMLLTGAKSINDVIPFPARERFE
jgi:elongation factor P--(R)-beta-lysine ligase